MEKPGKLPPLPALRAFESAARLLSYSRAAQELFVTHSAVSHQVKALEDHLGVTLFMRQGRQVVLTQEGQALAVAVNAALTQIAESAALLRRRASRNRLTVSVLPSFAARWLTPRIGRFIEMHPDIELNIIASKELQDFVRDGIDVAIRFGLGRWPGVHSERLMDETMFPVASPQLNGGRLPRTPADLKRYTLLRVELEDWTPWFRLVGLDWREPRGGVVFNDSGMVLQAAMDGQGIALARRSLAIGDIQAGRLVQLFDRELPIERTYYFAQMDPPRPHPLIERFREWIFAEMRRDFPPAE
ncbi:MAG: transcriptional regulator GcvA [Pseudomonadota bacterium]